MNEARITASNSHRLYAFAGGVVAFALLGVLAALGHLDAPDRYFLEAFRGTFGSVETTDRAWLRNLMLDVSSLGGAPVLVLLAGTSCAVLSIYGKKLHAIIVITTALGGQASIEIVKTLLNRARPGSGPSLEGGFPRGFPSGHTAEATIVFLTLAAVVAVLDIDRRVKTMILSIAALASFSVGASRIYLGDHWPSDVLAAWILGTAWALFALIVLERSEKTR